MVTEVLVSGKSFLVPDTIAAQARQYPERE